MIDDPETTARLMEHLSTALPVEVMLTRNLIQALSHQMQQPSLPMRCRVVDIHYAGEEGGIVCKLNLRGSETKQAFYVSITHLIFQRRMPLFRQIDAYQRHRIKKVKREGSLDH